MKKQAYFYLICILSLLSLFLFLGAAWFNTRGEPREAIVAYSMLEHGNWILPVNNGDEIAFKPPLLHWCIAALSWLTGSVTEFTSRFPSALALTLVTLAGFLFYAHRRDAETAFLTALVTLGNFEVHRAGMACRVDMLLAALMAGALYALFRWTEHKERTVPWCAWLCLSGAALTKGPVGVLLPCAVAGVYLLMRGRNLWSATWKLALLAVAAMLPLLSWYALAYQEPHGGERFLSLVYEENVLRLLGKMTYASHENPWPYNFQTVLAGYLPYTLLVILWLPAAWRSVARKWACQPATARRASFTQRLAATAKRGWSHLVHMDDVRLFSLLSIVIIFLFYCVPKSKRSTYLLPIYPFLAYFVAEGLIALRKFRPNLLWVFGCLLAGVCGLLTFVFLFLKCGGAGMVVPKLPDETAAFVRALAESPLNLLEMLAIVTPIAVSGYWLIVARTHERLASPQTWTAWLALMPLALFFALDGFYLPKILNVKSDRQVALDIRQICPQGTLYSYRETYIEANRMHPFTLNFYLDDRIIPIDKAPEPPCQGLLVTGDNDIEAFQKCYPRYDVLLLMDTHHRSCDDRRPLKVYAFQEKPIEK